MLKRRPLPSIDRAALMLIRKYGDECALEAYRRSRRCDCCGDEAAAAAEWRQVMRRVVDLHFSRAPGPLN